MIRLYRSAETTNQRVYFDIEPCGKHLATGGQVSVPFSRLELYFKPVNTETEKNSLKKYVCFYRMAWSIYMTFKVVNG
jgi:hypothetical protein